MQQFVVPQFIDVETKIIGPITARQFLIILAATLLVALFYRLFHFNTFLFLAIITLGIAATFAFARVNGRPFHYFVLNVFQTLRRPGLRVWNHKVVVPEKEEIIITKKSDYEPVAKSRYKSSRLAEISLIVDTGGKYKGSDK